MTVGEAIRAARGSRDQGWLAAAVGVHQSTISDWERGRNAPRPEKFPEIERALGMDPGTLARIHYGVPVYDDGEPAPEYPTDEQLRAKATAQAAQRPEDLEAEEQLSTLRDLTRGMSKEDIQRVIELLRITREQ